MLIVLLLWLFGVCLCVGLSCCCCVFCLFVCCLVFPVFCCFVVFVVVSSFVLVCCVVLACRLFVLFFVDGFALCVFVCVLFGVFQ